MGSSSVALESLDLRISYPENSAKTLEAAVYNTVAGKLGSHTTPIAPSLTAFLAVKSNMGERRISAGNTI